MFSKITQSKYPSRVFHYSELLSVSFLKCFFEIKNM